MSRNLFKQPLSTGSGGGALEIALGDYFRGPLGVLGL